MCGRRVTHKKDYGIVRPARDIRHRMQEVAKRLRDHYSVEVHPIAGARMFKPRSRVLFAITFAATCSSSNAVTRLPSADGQFWDIQDTSAWAQDSGGIATGGRSNPFNGFGYLKLQVRRADNTLLSGNQYLHGFGLAYDGGERFDSITPLLVDGIVVAREIFAPKDAMYLRYFDSFTNVTERGTYRRSRVGRRRRRLRRWRQTGGRNHRQRRPANRFDGWLRHRHAKRTQGGGPHDRPLRPRTIRARARLEDCRRTDSGWRHVRQSVHRQMARLRSCPHRLRVHAQTQTRTNRGAHDVRRERNQRDLRSRAAVSRPAFATAWSLLTSTTSTPASNQRSLPPGSEIARVTEVARKLLRDPDLRGLTPRQLASNRQLDSADSQSAIAPFTVFEKTVSQLQDAMTKGETTSEDITREYLARAAMYDRNGPRLSRNPRVQPTRDRRRACLRRRAGRRQSARTVSRRPRDLQRQHRCARPAQRPVARALCSIIDRASIRASPPACEGRRRRARQSQSRRVSLRRLRHQHRRRHDRKRLRSVAQHRRIERRQRNRRCGKPRRTRVRHRHLQLAFEPIRLCVAGHDSSHARPGQPRRRDAAQSLQRCRRTDGQVGARRRAGARPGRWLRRRRSRNR